MSLFRHFFFQQLIIEYQKRDKRQQTTQYRVQNIKLVSKHHFLHFQKKMQNFVGIIDTIDCSRLSDCYMISLIIGAGRNPFEEICLRKD